MTRLATITTLLLLCCSVTMFAQTAPNLTSNITWDEDSATVGNQATYADIAALQNAFNNARRKEETQLGLAPNTLGNLVVPADWAGRSQDFKALYLLNAERQCRFGVDYPNDGRGAVATLPFSDVEYNVDTMAQSHADYNVAANLFTHTSANGNDPFARIDNNAVVGGFCHDFVNRGENIAIFGTSNTANKMIIERSIYMWIYNSGSSFWVHRETVLLANMDINNNAFNGFIDDYGLTGSEGFIGIASAGADNGTYNPLGWSAGTKRVDIVVLNIIDPVVSPGCQYTIQPLTSLGVGAAAPVQLTAFGGTQDHNNILLKWNTQTELNNDFYTIERSNDGVRFTAIGTTKGAGTTDRPMGYAWIDEQPYVGTNYYRLKQTDFDGTEVIAATTAVKYADDITTQLYPNPAHVGGAVTLEIESAATRPLQICLFNTFGQLLYTTPFEAREGNNRIQLELPTDIKAGTYTVVLHQENAAPVTMPLVFLD